ncbi:META domain-containing protein [Flavobacterium sp. MAH-1]|uniref:META domain-containing protein n=1 Tax=Flavobacterium agri TaxID=2743471 RepID=A0A7Y8XZ81_9FLAO|nr:META domain-containing protein [Flavobacterium agri]NUY79447.1 META domain-containing protein [Flavobacterium agri]NYA69472.1 META domain-containing protein [Flavobacterium agri]
MKKLLIVLALALLASCKCKQPADPQFTKEGALDGNWMLEYVSGGDISGLYPGNPPSLFIDLKQNRASGKNGCNNYSGPITVVGNKITFSQNMIVTKMACPGNSEKTFMDAIQKVDAYAIGTDGKLNLISGDIAIMRFVKN